MSFGGTQLTSILQGETLYKISTGFTRLRQVVSLHPLITLEMKEQLAATSKRVQKLLARSLEHSGWIAHSTMRSKSDKVIYWLDLIDAKMGELQALSEEVSIIEYANDQTAHQDGAENIASQLLDVLEAAYQEYSSPEQQE